MASLEENKKDQVSGEKVTKPETKQSKADAPKAPTQQLKEAALSAEKPYRGRKVREGHVVSAAMAKTVIVKIVERTRHPRYAKTVQRSKRFHAHDEFGDLKNGDRVRIVETRPMSKLKRWRVAEVLERAK